MQSQGQDTVDITRAFFPRLDLYINFVVSYTYYIRYAPADIDLGIMLHIYENSKIVSCKAHCKCSV